MKKNQIETRKAVGQLICHDITKIEKGVFKGAIFKRGHRIREEDIDTLLDLGKNHIFTLELEEDELHEDEAGLRLAEALAGPGLIVGNPSEGRLDLTAEYGGLLKVDSTRLLRINSIPNVVAATLHNNTPLEKGEKVAGAKVIPLAVKEETVAAAEEICAEKPPLMEVKPYQAFRISGIITGREVFEGRIKDGFAPVLAQKAARFGQVEPETCYCPDDINQIMNLIHGQVQAGSNMVIVTGGMSVDPDDVTPTAINRTGAEIVKYGAPALPGAMFMLAYLGQVPVIGLPACAMYYENTILDILLPRMLAGEKITSEDIAALGHGGLCQRCETCTFPKCSFGKGSSMNCS